MAGRSDENEICRTVLLAECNFNALCAKILCACVLVLSAVWLSKLYIKGQIRVVSCPKNRKNKNRQPYRYEYLIFDM